jgi:hypothetical protein
MAVISQCTPSWEDRGIPQLRLAHEQLKIVQHGSALFVAFVLGLRLNSLICVTTQRVSVNNTAMVDTQTVGTHRNLA